MNCSTPGLPVHHQLLKSTQTHVHWVGDAVLSSVVPFSSCPQSFPASGSFQMSQLFVSGCQSIGVAASTSVLPMNTQDWSPIGWTGWTPCSPRDSQESSPTPRFKSINSSALSFLYSPNLISIHDNWKNHSLDFVEKVMSLFFNMLSRLVITFLPRSKRLLIKHHKVGLRWLSQYILLLLQRMFQYWIQLPKFSLNRNLMELLPR